MATTGDGEYPSPGKGSPRTWLRFFLPEGRMRVVAQRLPRDWFELLTRIPIVERLVIKRFVENLVCERWLEEPQRALQGLTPSLAAKDVAGQALLRTLLSRMEGNREKTPREMRRIRRRLGL